MFFSILCRYVIKLSCYSSTQDIVTNFIAVGLPVIISKVTKRSCSQKVQANLNTQIVTV